MPVLPYLVLNLVSLKLARQRFEPFGEKLRSFDQLGIGSARDLDLPAIDDLVGQQERGN